MFIFINVDDGVIYKNEKVIVFFFIKIVNFQVGIFFLLHYPGADHASEFYIKKA